MRPRGNFETGRGGVAHHGAALIVDFLKHKAVSVSRVHDTHFGSAEHNAQQRAVLFTPGT